VGTTHTAERTQSQAQLGELVAAARGGDNDAFAALVAALWLDLLAFARSVLGRAVDAEDVVQDALLVAWQQLPTLKSAASVRPWLLRIVYNRSMRYLKGRVQLLPIEAAQHEAIHLVTRDIDIPRMLAVLTPQQRAVVYLWDVEGLTCAEIGAALGVARVTVRVHRLQAIARLRRHLGVELP
jgi:RNA polymerase sigma-70 factor (ECF subfamily)